MDMSYKEAQNPAQKSPMESQDKEIEAQLQLREEDAARCQQDVSLVKFKKVHEKCTTIGKRRFDTWPVETEWNHRPNLQKVLLSGIYIISAQMPSSSDFVFLKRPPDMCRLLHVD